MLSWTLSGTPGFQISWRINCADRIRAFSLILPRDKTTNQFIKSNVDWFTYRAIYNCLYERRKQWFFLRGERYFALTYLFFFKWILWATRKLRTQSGAIILEKGTDTTMKWGSYIIYTSKSFTGTFVNLL